MIGKTFKPWPNDRNISQHHCWTHHVVHVWPRRCDMLGVIGSNLTISNLSQQDTCRNMSQPLGWGFRINFSHQILQCSKGNLLNNYLSCTAVYFIRINFWRMNSNNNWHHAAMQTYCKLTTGTYCRFHKF